MMKSMKCKKLCVILITLILLVSAAGCGKKNEYSAVKDDYISSYDKNTIIMNTSGDILEISVDDYNGVSFDYSQLVDYIKSEVEAYNKKVGGEKISFLQYGEKDGIVKSALLYNDFDSYNEFNNMNVTFSLYNAEYCDSIANEEFAKTHAAVAVSTDISDEDEEISDDQLAEAGLTRDEYEKRKAEQQQEQAEGKAPDVVTATFTDASSKETVDSSEITDGSIMMFTVPNAIDIKLDGGKFLYYNNHAVLSEDGVMSTDGEGTAIVVFKMNY